MSRRFLKSGGMMGRTGGFSGWKTVPFNPYAIANLKHRLDASVNPNGFGNNAGITFITDAGGYALGGLTSTGGNTFATFKTNIINGKSVYRWDRVMSVPNARTVNNLGAWNGTFTQFMVCIIPTEESPASGRWAYRWDDYDLSSNNKVGLIPGGGGGGFGGGLVISGTSGSVKAITAFWPYIGIPILMVHECSNTGDSHILRINGVQVATTGGTGSGSLGLNAYTGVKPGVPGAASDRAANDVGEWLIWSPRISTQDRNDAEVAIMSKWGIA